MSYSNFNELRRALRQYYAENGRDAEKPAFVYPISVTLEDGSTEEIGSQDEYNELRESCKE